MDVTEALLSSAGSSRHPWETARLRGVVSLMRAYAPELFASTSPVIFDVGCGDMFVLRTLAKEIPHGRLVGVDNALPKLGIHDGDEYVCEGCAGIRLYTSVPRAFGSCRDTVGAVLLLDVLEHVDDDRDFLAGIVSAPCVGGNTRFFITTPAFGFLFSSHDLFLGHRRRYSVGQLRSVAAGAGLAVEASGYFFCSLFFLRLLQAAFEHLRGGQSRPTHTKGIGGYAPKPVLDAIISSALYADFRLCMAINACAPVLPGLSSFAICTKAV